MAERKGRILLGKLGEGHKEAQLNLAKSLGKAGFEVIYTELKEPEAIVRSALHESADHIGITTLQGADIQAFEEIIRLLKAENAGYISITAGGFLDDEDIGRTHVHAAEKGPHHGFPGANIIERHVVQPTARREGDRLAIR